MNEAKSLEVMGKDDDITKDINQEGTQEEVKWRRLSLYIQAAAIRQQMTRRRGHESRE